MVDNSRMQKIAYLLHRFPRQTDTFIMREIRALERLGLVIHVVAVWPPTASETTLETRAEWSSRVTFLMGSRQLSIATRLFSTIMLSPIRFASTAWLAWQTSRDGVRGCLNQLFYLAEAILASRILKSGSYAHVHNHFGDHSGTVTMLAAHFCKLPFSLSIHGPHIFFDSPSAAMREKVQRARFCRCISYYCRSQLMYLSGVMNVERFPIVRCGIETQLYSLSKRRGKIKTIFCASRLAPEKGLSFLLEAMQLLNDQGHQLTLRLAGTGPSRDSLEQLVRKRHLSDQVHFLGNLNEKEIAGELNHADLFVLPSLAEGLPVSIMEAMASGVPVVVSNVAGISELVENSVTGFLVQATNSVQLAQRIESLIRTPDLINAMVENARHRVGADFDIAVEAQKLSQWFCEGIARNKSAERTIVQG